ncbi:MAG TPA: cupin domain-containing protein [Thermomicrobiales bacterium]|nr:cupin domain-containing protein [Thermomicrobiales bacterium]
MASNVATEIGCSCVPPDGGERIRIFDEEIVVKVVGEETAGAYALISMSVAPGGGPPLHAHPGCETAYVLAGEFAFTQRTAAGVSTFHAGPGAIVHAPGGAAHRFENVGTARATLLQVLSPELVAFLRELGEAFPPGAQPNLETMLAINAKYGSELFYGGGGSRPEPALAEAASARARARAWRFQQANEALIAIVAGCAPQQWRAICADTGWTVGVQAHHVAEGEAAIAGVIRQAAEGQPSAPMPPALLDQINARHAEEFASVTKAETLALLRENGALAAPIYRALTDAQLERTATFLAGSPAASVAQLIEYLAIGEIERHGAAIRDAISA